MFSKNNTGPMPPPIMLLSDGGHVENLGLLPLLKKRLKRIIVVDGGYKHDQKLYGESLLNALMLARTKLKCSFLSVGGKDVISDVMEKFVSPVKETGGKRPRFYKLVSSIFCPILLDLCVVALVVVRLNNKTVSKTTQNKITSKTTGNLKRQHNFSARSN